MTTYTQTGRAGRSHLGFSMIDVLVAIIVLATGLLALGVLQGALTRNSADARARTQIAAYTQSLLDETRASGYDTFGTVTSVTASSSACAASPQSFSQKLQCDAYNAQTRGGVSAVTTTISSTEYYGSTGGTWVTPKPSGATDKTPHFKKVDVTTTWNDALGQSRSLTYNTTVSPVTVTPTDNSLATSGFNLSTSSTPQVRESNPGNTLGVIPIAISGTSNAAATNPKPVVTNTGTTFSQYTYNSTASSYGGNLITARIDTKVIQCNCKYIAAGGVVTTDPNLGTILQQPYRPTYWDGYHYLSPTATTATSSTTGVDSSATQDPDCDVCCRDRNDTSSDTVKFDNFTTSGGSADYNHYKYTVSGGVYTLTASTDSYQQACRMVRKDGAYATAPDTHNYFYGLLSTDTCANQGSSAAPTGCTSSLTFSDTVPSSTTEDSYASFVKDYLKTNLTSFKTTGKSGETSASPLTTGSTAAGKWNGSFSLNTPTNTTIQLPNTVGRWLYARGLYVDYLETQAQQVLQNAITNCTDSDVNNCALPVMPFTTINMSELSNWSSSQTGVIKVSDTAIIGGDETSPKRGNVTVPSGADGSGHPSANANGNSYLTNTSLTGNNTTNTSANSPYDASTANQLNDQRQFTLQNGGGGGGGGNSTTLYFVVSLTGLSWMSAISNSSLDPSVGWVGSAAQIGTASGQDATAPVSANSLTAYLTTSGSGGNKTYTAQYAGTSSTAPETVGITNTAPVGLDVVVQNFNTSASNGTETINCTNSAGNPIPETFTTATQCLNYAVNTAGVTIGGTAVAGVTTSLLPGTTDGGMKEGAIVVLPSTPGISSTTNTIAGATAVNIPFTLTATTIPPGTCTCSNTTCSPANKITYKPGTCSN